MEENKTIKINSKFAEIIVESLYPELRQEILEQINKNKCQKFDIILKNVYISECELRQEFGVEEIKFTVMGG